jgi:polyhydroxybutyrate depolymerase
MRIFRLTAVLCTVFFLAMAALACRGDDDGESPSATPTRADSPTSSATPTTPPSSTTTETPNPFVTPTPTLPEGEPIGPLTLEAELTVDGRDRSYRLYVPSTVIAGFPAPLVIGMHGGFGTGEQFARTSEFDAQAEAGRFIVVYPNGTGTVPTWNGGACCGFAVRENVDDVAFIDALIDEIARKYPVDQERIFAVGHSNGAIMALRLACELSDRIAAVGSVAGSLEIEACNPPQPVSVLMIHGDADLNHPLEGGEGPQSIAGVPFNSVADTMETMRVAAGCSSGTQVTRDIDITVTIWACPDGVAVEQQIIAGGTHAWPGSDQVLLSGPASQAMDATEVLWNWLEDKGR